MISILTINNGGKYMMNYPKFPDINKCWEQITEYSRLKFEYGSEKGEIQALIDDVEKQMKAALEKVKNLRECSELKAKEPDSLEGIRALRPDGIRQMSSSFDKETYIEKLKGAMLGRFAGCTLGAPVEAWSIKAMKDWAEYNGDAFPPVNYWTDVKDRNWMRYEMSECYKYTKTAMENLPTDDDITYTILGLLIAEDYGLDFSIDDVGKAWVKYLPCACTAEDIALKNLKAGKSAYEVADIDNPYVQWIGADIRADPWAYINPGLPEKAAEMAYRDAYISHRRNGIYGEMYFAAAIAAAFEADNCIDALKIGLQEIPQDCLLANDVKWALEVGGSIKDYMAARKAVDDRFIGMSGVHTNINACLTIFGLMLAGDDFTKLIGEVVAMGYDNDCTAATAASIFGAVYGIKSIPEHWYNKFNNTAITYIIGHPQFKIDDLVNRFALQVQKVFELHRSLNGL